MKDHSGMREIWQTRCFSFRDSMLMALAICGAARGSEACAAESAANFELPRSQLAAPLLPPPLLPHSLFAPPVFAPSLTRAPAALEPEAFSATEFRPRRRGLLEVTAGARESTLRDMPRLQDTSVARQMAEFKSQDRLRLLTLWQSHASSLSLQAGKRGAPSLQWSTPWMHRDSGSRGLFDRLLAVSPHDTFGAPRGNTPRQSGVSAASKSLESNSSAKAQ
jgi:hypothetical protein